MSSAGGYAGPRASGDHLPVGDSSSKEASSFSRNSKNAFGDEESQSIPDRLGLSNLFHSCWIRPSSAPVLFLQRFWPHSGSHKSKDQHHNQRGGLFACVFLVVAVVLIVLVGVFSLILESTEGPHSYAVIIDAGSTGSRVHVFRFKMASGARVLKDEIFHAIKPGLKAHALDPVEAAKTLEPLMATAVKHVPEKLRSSTPLTLRATAGLRLLPEGQEAASALLEASKMKVGEYGFRMDDEYVSILDGMYEGAYGWIAVNYLLRKLSGSVKATKTVAVADLGGGSTQIMYAIGDRDEVKRSPEGYVLPLEGYDVYTKSFKGFGIMAARAKILTQNLDAGDEGWRAHPCAAKGFRGGCTEKCYGLEPGEGYSAIGREEGGDFDQCVDAALMAMEKESMECQVEPCSFAGAWTTKRTTPLYGMSYFYERAQAAKAVRWPNSETKAVKITPSDYKRAGKRVCQTHVDSILKEYPDAEEDHFEYLCLDLAYIYALLTKGYGLKDNEPLHLVDKIDYKGQPVEAAWALGDAIAVMNTFN